MAWRLVRSLVSCRPTHYFAALCEGGLSAGLRASTTALNAAPTGAVAEPAMNMTTARGDSEGHWLGPLRSGVGEVR